MQNTQDKLLSLDQARQIVDDRRSGKALHERKNGKLVVDHVGTANVMVMFIANCPMDKWFKKILIMRIGAPLIHKRPMSHLAIALELKMLESEVRTIEAEAIKICEDYMTRCTGAMTPQKDNKSLIIDTLNHIR